MRQFFVAVVECDGDLPDPSGLASDLARTIGQARAVAYCALPEDPARAANSCARNSGAARPASELLAALVDGQVRRDAISKPSPGPQRSAIETIEASASGRAPTGRARERLLRPRKRDLPALREAAASGVCAAEPSCSGLAAPAAEAPGNPGARFGAPSGFACGCSADRSAGADRTVGSAVAHPMPGADRAIRVTIAIDRPVLRQRACLRLGQAADIEVRCGGWDEVAASSPEADRPASRVMVIDDAHFARLGADAVRASCGRRPDLRVLLVSDRVDPCGVDDVLGGGIRGILPAAGPAGAWRRAVRAVTRGELWLPRAMLARMVELRYTGGAGPASAADGARSLPAPEGPLTSREAAVVAELRQGFSNKEIASRLGICEDTVKKHLQNVFSKLGVRRRTELLKWPLAAR